jgi:Phage terminase large subunit/Terminase RNaseH-like domain
VRNVVRRAIKAPNSRHVIARFRFNHLKASVILDTFPKVMALCFPGIKQVHQSGGPGWYLSKSDWFVKLPNGSEIWFAGLDDKERTERVLGMEFVTIFLNECSQISWEARMMVVTRLAQLVQVVRVDKEGKPLDPHALKPRVFYDCNPPSKGHWTFKFFHQKVDPETREPLTNPDDIVHMRLNPLDNTENLSPDYLKTLAGLSMRMRRRFEFGEYADANPNALFNETDIDKWRVMDGVMPQLVRVVIPVDPSGSGDEDNADNDEIGIAALGLGVDGNAYVFEDLSLKAGPGTWGAVAVDAYQRHKADVVVGEANFGGDMVRFTIQTAAAAKAVRVNYKAVTASRGKVVRAEPFSALYEQGKVRHIGILARLEDELCAMSTHGYTGQGSPNRADAVIWGLAELFPAIVAPPKKPKREGDRTQRGAMAGGWMG